MPEATQQLLESAQHQDTETSHHAAEAQMSQEGPRGASPAPRAHDVTSGKENVGENPGQCGLLTSAQRFALFFNAVFKDEKGPNAIMWSPVHSLREIQGCCSAQQLRNSGFQKKSQKRN